MGEYTKIKGIVLIGVGLFIFSLIECIYYVFTYGHPVIWQELLTTKILLLSIPILFIISVIVKIIKRDEDFIDILLEVYGPFLIWVALLSLVAKN